MISQPQLIDILLVEDNDGDVELTREIFSDSKLRNYLHVVKDGQAAIDFLKGDIRPELILLDIHLPKKDGIEVLNTIRDDAHLKSIPVALMVSSQAEKDMVVSQRHPADFYLIKPVTMVTLLQCVRTLDMLGLALVKLPNDNEKAA